MNIQVNAKTSTILTETYDAYRTLFHADPIIIFTGTLKIRADVIVQNGSVKVLNWSSYRGLTLDIEGKNGKKILDCIPGGDFTVFFLDEESAGDHFVGDCECKLTGIEDGKPIIDTSDCTVHGKAVEPQRKIEEFIIRAYNLPDELRFIPATSSLLSDATLRRDEWIEANMPDWKTANRGNGIKAMKKDDHVVFFITFATFVEPLLPPGALGSDKEGMVFIARPESMYDPHCELGDIENNEALILYLPEEVIKLARKHLGAHPSGKAHQAPEVHIGLYHPQFAAINIDIDLKSPYVNLIVRGTGVSVTLHYGEAEISFPLTGIEPDPEPESDTIKVRITRCSYPAYWYSRSIDGMFEVRKDPYQDCYIAIGKNGYAGRRIQIEDCEIVP